MVTEKPFAVKDPEEFKKELEANGVHPIQGSAEGLCYDQEQDGRFWLGGYDASLEGWNPEKDEEVDMVPIIQKHMENGEVAVFMGVGQEKLRNVGGYVHIVTPEESLWDDLHSTMERLLKQAEDSGERLKRGVKRALAKR